MNNRQKEDKRMKDLKNPKDDHSAEISKLINQVISSKHKVYVTTDWHLWKRVCKDRCSPADEIYPGSFHGISIGTLLLRYKRSGRICRF